jgi:hypothetical protein
LRLKLTGGPVSPDDFRPDNALRLWEYGVGDRVRQSTGAILRRVGPGEYELSADAGVVITLAGKTRTVTAAELEVNRGVVRIVAVK